MKRNNAFTFLLSVVMILMLPLTACSRGNSPASASSLLGSGSTAEASTSSNMESASEEPTSSSAAPFSARASSATPSSAKSTSTSPKTLVAYFSRVGNTNFSDTVDAISSASLNIRNNDLIGSTEIVARQIHDLVGGDLVEIQTVEPYPADYKITVQQNVDEAEAGVKPELQTRIENMDSYGTVYIGYPTWAMDIPRPIASFLSGYDFKGKTIIPFNTNGGYGLGGTVGSIKELCPDSTILDAFEMPGANVRDAQGVQRAISEWMHKIGVTK